MSRILAIKRDLYKRLNRLGREVEETDIYRSHADWFGSHPFNEVRGIAAIRDIRMQVANALPDLERRDSIFVAGYSAADDRPAVDPEGTTIVAAMGHFVGTFENALVDIPPTGDVVRLRFCESHRVDETGRIVHSHVLLDFLDLMRQAGRWPIAPSLGAEGTWLDPRGGGGVDLDRIDKISGRQSLQTVLSMHNALGQFDGKDIDSMLHAEYWTRDFLYFGPSGIGTTRGMCGFRAHHQIPFLTGFRDRKGSGHYMRIGDGQFVVTGGWPSVVATHTGEWLALPPTQKRIAMRVMDFYRLEDGRIAENWVPIDIIHILLQMGVDVFARLRHLTGNPPMKLPD